MDTQIDSTETVSARLLSNREKFLNRQLSWLEFNRRVLHQAIDERTPLLERLRFLSIFTSNLDEFFMKRVGGLKRQISAGVMTQTSDGMSPEQQLNAIRDACMPMLDDQAACYTQQIRKELKQHGIHLLQWAELEADEKEEAIQYFQHNVFPVLTPLAVDPGHPFPFISNLSTSLGVKMRYPDRDEKVFARVKIPEVLPHWVRLNSPAHPDSFRYYSLLDLIRNRLEDLFPGMQILAVMPFRITRNADVERDEEDAEDLLEMIEEELRERRFADVVRLEHGSNPDLWIQRFLMDALGLSYRDIYELKAELDYTSLAPVCDLNLPALRFAPWTPLMHPMLTDEQANIFNIIRSADILLHHPYESFTGSVERFVKTAATDPDVLAIKMTLYRVGESGTFIEYLIRAAEAGKQVICLVELKARFDEERNIYWAHALEKAGVHVVYGLVGYKTHTKTTLVVRREGAQLRSYVHIGTGNYNAATAKLYTDLGLFTCHPAFTNDIVQLFHYLTGRSLKRNYEKLLVAPVNMKQRFQQMIQREIDHKQTGKPARIIAKMNSLEDMEICTYLYEASQAGVPIDLIVRGFCCLKPGVRGLSENIRVVSTIGRFLEHSRIFYFQNAHVDPLNGEFYIGSADWMYRNLHSRVEVIAPIEHRAHKERCWEILELKLSDLRQTWDMQPDGTYRLRKPQPGDPEIRNIGPHQALMNLARQRTLGVQGSN